MRLNKLTISEFTTIAGNNDQTLNLVNYFISRPESC